MLIARMRTRELSAEGSASVFAPGATGIEYAYRYEYAYSSFAPSALWRWSTNQATGAVLMKPGRRPAYSSIMMGPLSWTRARIRLARCAPALWSLAAGSGGTGRGT